MCNEMERVSGYYERCELYRKELKRRRSAVLHQMQLLGINTAEWGRVDAYCQDKRISGKKFRELDCEELDALVVRLRVIRRKKENHKKENQ